MVQEGLPDLHLSQLAAASRPPEVRLANKEIVFLGAWSLRKGKADWREIVRCVRQVVPGARFSFHGTGVTPDRVLADLGVSSCDGVVVTEHYRSEELPELLRNATAGALPSYVEGCGLGVVEQLAAGVPTVAYDVPGPRMMLGAYPELLAPPGWPSIFAERLSWLLSLDAASYGSLARCSQECAAAHRLSKLVRLLVGAYERALLELHPV
jgi:glycosyltransferase involved in cell wall biosynthesis